MQIRRATPDEMAEVGELRVAAYRAKGLLAVNPGYAVTLRSFGTDEHSEVYVAAENGRVLGTITLHHWNSGPIEVAKEPGEAVIRVLAVAPDAQGRGIGRALVRSIIDRATAAGVRHLVLSTRPTMVAAQHLYRTSGFVRLPDRDWSPVPDINLLAFGRLLANGDAQ